LPGAILLQKYFVHVAPFPALARLKRPHNGVLGLMEVLGSVGVLGGVAAAYMAADQAFPQVDPGIAHLQAFLAALSAGSYFFDFFDVGAGGLNVGHWSPLLFLAANGSSDSALSNQHLAFSHYRPELVLSKPKG
jgi:hypothetical protein